MTVHLHMWFHRKRYSIEGSEDYSDDKVFSYVYCGKNIEIPDEKVDGCQLGFSKFPGLVWDDQLDKVTCEECIGVYSMQVLGEL